MNTEKKGGGVSTGESPFSESMLVREFYVFSVFIASLW